MADPAAATQTAPPAAEASGSVVGDALKALQTGTAKPAAGATTAPAAGATTTSPAATTAPATTTTDATSTAPTPATATGEIKLTVPKDSGLTEDHVKQVADFAKANGLTQAQAEKILERDTQGAGAQKAAQAKAQTEYLANVKQAESAGRAAWSKDPDFGGVKANESNIDVARVLSKYADEGLQKFLTENPEGRALGSDPLFLRFCARIGAAHLREDAGTGSASAPPRQPSTSSIDEMSSVMYPNGSTGKPRVGG